LPGSHRIDQIRQRVKNTPDGWFDPWMLAWQLTQERLKTFLSVCAYGCALCRPPT
jgi:hypothetical protein